MSVLRRKLRRDLRRDWPQALAIAVTVFLGAALFVASYDAYRNLEASYDDVFAELRFADLFVSGGDVEAFAADARRVVGVQSAETRVAVDTPLEIGGQKLLGRTVGMPSGDEPKVNRVLLLAGSGLEPGEHEGVLAEQHLAQHFALSPGDHLRILGSQGWTEVEVRGIAASAEYLWPARSRQDILPAPGSFGVVFAPDSLAQHIAGTGKTETVVRYEPGAPNEVVTSDLRRLAARHGASRVFTRDEQPSNAALSTDIQGFSELAVLFPFLFLSAAGMAVYVLVARRVRAERAIIGTLLANGASRRHVVWHYLGFGVVLGLAGAIPGALAGSLLGAAITRLYTGAIDLPLTVVVVRPGTAVVAIAFGLVVGIIAAVPAAYGAARVPPAEAMRGVEPLAQGGSSLVERAIPPLRRLPSRILLVLRSLGRNRRRTLSTVLGVVLAATLILVSWGMLDTTQLLVARQFDEIEQQDATLRLTTPANEQAITRLGSVTGVAAVEPAAELDVVLSAEGSDYATSLIGLDADTTMHRFLSGERETNLPAHGLVTGVALRDQLGVAAGDVVQVVVPATGAAFDERLAGFVDEPLGTFAYSALDGLPPTAGGANIVLARFEDSADRDAVLGELQKLPLVASVTDARALADAVEGFMGLFYAILGIMLAFGAAMAFAIIFTTMSANVAERSVEVATLRASGVRYQVIARLITAENLLVVCLGLVPGLLAGYVVARLFMSTYSSDLFRFDLQLRPTTPLLIAIALILVALASQWPGLRAVGRLEIARVVRERAH